MTTASILGSASSASGGGWNRFGPMPGERRGIVRQHGIGHHAGAVDFQVDAGVSEPDGAQARRGPALEVLRRKPHHRRAGRRRRAHLVAGNLPLEEVPQHGVGHGRFGDHVLEMAAAELRRGVRPRRPVSLQAAAEWRPEIQHRRANRAHGRHQHDHCKAERFQPAHRSPLEGSGWAPQQPELAGW